MKKKLVFTVGNEMMGDDAAGPLLARMLEQSPLDGWGVLDGGSAPENYVHRIREMAPEQVLIVDTADMDLRAGEVRHIDAESVGSLFLMTTHSLPLSYLMHSIGEFVPSVMLIGIQPEVVAFGCPISSAVNGAVKHVYSWLKQNPDASGAVKFIGV